MNWMMRWHREVDSLRRGPALALSDGNRVNGRQKKAPRRELFYFRQRLIVEEATQHFRTARVTQLA
ncbi:hypothetical protein NL514_28595, partial [Klebsiella pneumoniae]|nr:hypothetical protein [Klebsiella pneumoniae]